MFNKDVYWRNRKASGRGQGVFDPIVAAHPSPDWPQKPVTKKALLKNSKRARRTALERES